MSSDELQFLSQHYVDNYEIFHGIVKGSSRESSIAVILQLSLVYFPTNLQAKAQLLRNISAGLAARGYPHRTSTQIEQRIRDNLKKSREVFQAQVGLFVRLK